LFFAEVGTELVTFVAFSVIIALFRVFVPFLLEAWREQHKKNKT